MKPAFHVIVGGRFFWVETLGLLIMATSGDHSERQLMAPDGKLSRVTVGGAPSPDYERMHPASVIAAASALVRPGLTTAGRSEADGDLIPLRPTSSNAPTWGRLTAAVN